MVAVVHKPINLIAFLLGLSLAFVPFAHAESICRTVQNLSGGSQNVWVGDQWAYQSWTHDPVVVGIFVSGGVIKKYEIDAGGGFYRLYGGSGGNACSDPVPFPGQEPVTCSDGILTAGEVGLDCGGECSDICDSSICENQSATLSDGLCSEHTSPDAFGNCPSGTTLIYTDDSNVCATSPVPAIQYFSGDLQDPSGDVVDDGFFAGVDFPLSGVDDPFESGQLSIVESIAPTSTVDNGDGTSTVTTTTTTTTTNNEGDISTSTSTNSFNIDNGTGNKIDGTEQTITDDEIPVEATPLIAAPEGLDFGDKLTDLLNSSSAEFESYVDDVQGSDLVQHFTDVFTLPDDPGDSPLSISMGAYGVHLVDSQMMDTTLSLVGQVLVVCAFIAGAYIVFRKQ